MSTTSGEACKGIRRAKGRLRRELLQGRTVDATDEAKRMRGGLALLLLLMMMMLAPRTWRLLLLLTRPAPCPLRPPRRSFPPQRAADRLAAPPRGADTQARGGRAWAGARPGSAPASASARAACRRT